MALDRLVLILARADVAASVRSLIAQRYGVPSKWLAATPLRRSSDSAGTATYYCAHGGFTSAQWDALQQVLVDATQGVRDSADWQDKSGGGTLADAEWAIAYQGGTTDADIVAGYLLTRTTDGTDRTPPLDVLAARGFLFMSQDQVQP